MLRLLRRIATWLRAKAAGNPAAFAQEDLPPLSPSEVSAPIFEDLAAFKNGEPVTAFQSQPRMGEQSAPWMAVARAERGVKEVEGEGDNPRILEYHSKTKLRATDDSVAWCSAFVCWVMDQAGFLSTESAAARSWLSYGERLEVPRPGCIVILSRGTQSWQGHVGFFVSESGPYIRVLGGNQSNEVNEAWYRRDRLLGYRWPTEAQKKP